MLKAETEGAEDGVICFRNRYEPDLPPTGDSFRPLTWMLLSAAALLLSAALLFIRKKQVG